MGAIFTLHRSAARRVTACMPVDLASWDVERYSSLGGAIQKVHDVLQMAQCIEPNPDAVMLWYFHTRIEELDSLTAEQLVRDGQACRVLRFLRSIQSGERD